MKMKSIGYALALIALMLLSGTAQAKGGKGKGGGGGHARGKHHGSAKHRGGGHQVARHQGGSHHAQPKHHGGAIHHGGGHQVKHHQGGSHHAHHGGSRRHHVYLSPYGIGYAYYGHGLSFNIGRYDPYYVGYDDRYYGGYDIRYHDAYGYGPAYCAASPRTYTTTEVYVENAPAVSTSQDVATYPQQAEQAFRRGRYDEAVGLARHAVIDDSENGKLHLILSQAFFATGDYRAAASAIYRGVSLLDREQWGYVVKNRHQFYTGDDYDRQLSRLSEFVANNPDVPFARLVRGYHYVFLGDHAAAREDLTKVVALESRDRLAADLLALMSDRAPSGSEKLPEPK